jgi:hypothetical protein
MLLWFAVVAPFLVAEIFRSPMVDYRLVAVGALLPVLEVVIGRPFVLHTLAAPVVVLTVTMAATTGRRLLRRRLLGISIGLFLHLVLDGTWTSAELFWWPLFGVSFAGLDVPEATAPGWRLVLELVAVAVAVVAWRRHGLDDPAARQRLMRSGHLPAAVRFGGR